MTYGTLTLTSEEDVRTAAKLGFDMLAGIRPGTLRCDEAFMDDAREHVFATKLTCTAMRTRKGRPQFYAHVGSERVWVSPRGAWSLTIERQNYSPSADTASAL